ncbi:MAG: hypothetical protein V3V40_05865 [Nitrosomonadaceae bacterium]
MTQVSQPSTTVNITSAVTQVANEAQKLLFIGQKNAIGTATPGALIPGIQNDNSWNTLFGIDSMLAAMIRSARLLNDVSEFDAIALADNGSGVAATGTMTVTGAATADGTFTVTVGSQQNSTNTVTVTSGDSVTVVASAIAAAITATQPRPVSAGSTAGVVTITAINDGTYGNSLGLEIVGAVAGISIAIVAMASGANDPVLTAVFDVVGDTRYQGVVWPYPDDTSVVRTFLDARFNVDDDVLDGVAFTSKTDTLANLQSTYSALNSQSLLVIGDEVTNETLLKNAPSVFEIPAVKASEFAAIRALRLTAGASVAQFLAGEAGLDSFGGPALASRPYFNTPFPNIPISVQGRGFTKVEVESLFDDGVSVMGNNRAANSIIMGEAVTTYKTDTAGNPDQAFKFLNFVDTASGAREFFVNNLNSRFAQSRLTEGDLVPGRPMANAQLILSTLTEFYTTLSGSEFSLTQSGETARSTFISNTTVTIDLATGLATILMNNVPLVSQLRTFNATMRITFSANG